MPTDFRTGSRASSRSSSRADSRAGVSTGRVSRRLPDRIRYALAQRRRGGRRSRMIRRIVALSLVITAGALALSHRPEAPDGERVYVAAGDFATGHILGASDMRAATVTQLPDGVLTPPHEIAGQILAAPMRRGEILTDVRLVETAIPAAGEGRTAVPVRSIEPAVSALLSPGMHVAVLSIDVDNAAELLCDDAIVLWTEQPEGSRLGAADSRLVLLSVPDSAADVVTSAALHDALGIRFS